MVYLKIYSWILFLPDKPMYYEPSLELYLLF